MCDIYPSEMLKTDVRQRLMLLMGLFLSLQSSFEMKVYPFKGPI